MITKHELPTRNADLLGFHLGVPTDVGRKTMWTKARILADDGLKYLRDPNAAAIDLAAMNAKNAPPKISLSGITVHPTVGGGLKVLQLTSEAPAGPQTGDVIVMLGDAKIIHSG